MVGETQSYGAIGVRTLIRLEGCKTALIPIISMQAFKTKRMVPGEAERSRTVPWLPTRSHLEGRTLRFKLVNVLHKRSK